MNRLNLANSSWIFTNPMDQSMFPPVKKNNTINNILATNIFEINTNLKETINSYEKAKQSFYSNMDNYIDDLKQKIKDTNAIDFSTFSVKDILQQEEIKNRQQQQQQQQQQDISNNKINDKNISINSPKYSQQLQKSLDTVYELINSYNDLTNFFNENESVSKRISNINSSLNNFAYYAGSYNSIGLRLSNNNEIIVDENQLIQAIIERPNTVNNILHTFTNRISNSLNSVSIQYDNLFPNIENILGDQFKMAKFYTSSAFVQLQSFMNTGNIVNFFL